MKNLKATLITLSVTIITFIAFGQMTNNKTSSSPENAKYIYCELWENYLPVGPRSTLLNSVPETKTYLDFGSKSIYQRQAEEDNKVRSLKDGIDALNYMSENGWDFVSKYTRDYDGGIEHVSLLRKKIK